MAAGTSNRDSHDRRADRLQGKKLSKPSRVDGKLEIFSYLNGDVIHYKVLDEGHGATGAVGEKVLLDFLNGGTSDSSG
jgi:hypothetical protein